jgi:PKD repeat protein
MWDFNGDNLIDSYQPNPVFTYEEAGTYNVKLRVCCSSLNYFDYEEKQNYITVDEGLMYGDVDDNRLVESVDAGLVLMHTVGFDPIPEDPLPWEEWRRIQADVDLDEEISAVDGAYILQYVVGIIEELPISGRDRFPKGKIALFCEDNYINLIAESDMYTLELDLNEFRQLDPEALELIAQDCITYQSGERFALISANGLKGKVLRIPYSKESVQATSLSFNPAVNGYNEKISLHFSDHIQLISTITSIYPNPFNPETSIQLYIAEDSQVNLSIYNLKGQLITELISEFKEMGNYSVIWNGMDKDSQYVSSGVYLIRFSAEGILEFSKIVYLK